MSLLTRIKKKARRSLEWLKLHRETILDAQRYYRAASWAGPVARHELAHIHAELIKHYHVVEKGLVMADFRPRSGVPVVKRLIVLTSIWKEAGGDPLDFHLQAAMSVIRAYYHKHEKLGVDVSDFVPAEMVDQEIQVSILGGSKPAKFVPKDDLAVFDRIALSRHSVRQFDLNRVPDRELLNAAVEVALSAPSVCNRQTWRTHFYDGDATQKVLSLQNGNRGFGHLIPTVAIVTSDMRYFAGGPERYQGWIEGGLFSMNFLLALHARGISSVALNWSRLNKEDEALREMAGIPAHERIIMLIGIGYAMPGHLVAASPRSPSREFITWH